MPGPLKTATLVLVGLMTRPKLKQKGLMLSNSSCSPDAVHDSTAWQDDIISVHKGWTHLPDPG